MTAAQFAQLRDQVLALDEDERAMLRDEIDASLTSADDDQPLSPAWQAEIERRIKQVRSGEMPVVPADTVIGNLHAIARGTR